MKSFQIGAPDAGQRLDKYLQRLLKEADSGFLYRMLRKKNITLNGKKASGSERLAEGDQVSIFFSDETLTKFLGEEKRPQPAGPQRFTVIYEDDQILVVNKPAGLLTQKSTEGDDCLTDQIAAYVLGQGGTLSRGFTPSAANRLDRNTSGLVLAGKTLPGQQLLSRFLRDGLLEKYYLCLVAGTPPESGRSRLYWSKDETENVARISRDKAEGSLPIELAYRRLESYGVYSLLQVQLISGKSHQIRAQLAFLGYPVVGDKKYGERSLSEEAQAKLGRPLHHQLLFSHEVVFPPFQEEETLSEAARTEWIRLSGKRISAPIPPVFVRLIRELGGQYGK